MYRILNKISAPTYINKPILKHNLSIYHSSHRTVYCTSCRCEQLKVACSKTSRRNRSSCTNLKSLANVENAMKIRKRNKPKLKYTELLEVSESNSNVTKAVVEKFTPQHMTVLTEDPNMTLEQLYNLDTTVQSKNTKLHSTANSTDINKESVPSIFDADNLFSNTINTNNLGIINNRLLLSTSHSELREDKPHIQSVFKPHDDNRETGDSQSLNHTQNKKKSGKKKITSETKQSAVTSQKNLERLQRAFNNSLRSYIHVCVSCGYLNRAVAALFYYANYNKFKQPLHTINDIANFNLLMHGFASKGNLNKVNELYNVIKRCKMKPTIQSFAACFECIGRIPDSPEKTERVEFFHRELQTQNLTLDDLFKYCKYTDHQRTYVLKGVKHVDPNFSMPLMNHDLKYSCPLVSSLDEKMDNNETFISPARGLITSNQMNSFLKKQFALERELSVAVKSVEKPKEVTPEILHYRKKWSDLEETWRMSIREAFAREVKTLRVEGRHTNAHRRITIYPYVRVLTSEQYVNIMMQAIRNLARGSETYSSTLNQLSYSIGYQVKLRYELKFKQAVGISQKTEQLYKEYCNWYLHPESNKDCLNARQYWQTLLDKYQHVGPSMDIEYRIWPAAVLIAIGRFLYGIIIKDLKIDVNCLKKQKYDPHYVPVFYNVYRFKSNKNREELKPHPVFTKLFRMSAQEDIEFDTNMIPMLSPPLPWVTINNGGYVVNKADFTRLNLESLGMLKSIKYNNNTPPQQLYPVFDSLNQLSTIPWTINEKVLDLMIGVFQAGGSEELNIPLSSTAFVSLKQTADMSKAYSDILALNTKKSEAYGLWCEALYKLSLANHFRGKIFWLPHNIDFRGRVYPVPPHLQHLGSDLARALLIFARGEPLGPGGFDWLKIHCINLTGLKKRNSLKERLEYANDVLPDILDSAENPLTGKKWWLTSDDPWQTLACCMEIKAVLESGNPENYVCHLPIHQDGSCNGLQHYAALGRDRAGAEGVNLCPSDVPQDVYNCVVNLVEKQRQQDAQNGIKIAKVLEGYVQRKVIKQTVMTTVYGVTRYGARQQIIKQIKDIESFPQELAAQAADYLVMQTFRCIREMFTSAREIQDWFTECAKIISVVYDRNVEWVTPLGLPIIQPYSKITKNCVTLDGAGDLVQYAPRDFEIRIDSRKQKNAFPPNFVHSLDSTHMMLTSLHLERKGVTFVSVHDCFWTHPCTVDIMNKVCREQFVALHSYPILENLSEYFCNVIHSLDRECITDNVKQECLRTFRMIPRKGTHRLEDVLESVYFFS